MTAAGTIRDLRVALRALGRGWTRATVAVAVMATSMTTCVVLFVVADGILLKPLPFQAPEQLFVIGPPNRTSSLLSAVRAVNEVQFEEIRALAFVSGALGYSYPAGLFEFEYSVSESLLDVEVSVGFFEELGVRPLAGRSLLAVDAGPADPRPVVIGHALWRGRFGADPGLVGRIVTLGGRRVEVVGIMPRGFDFPGGANVWLAAGRAPERPYRSFRAVVRVATVPPHHVHVASAGECVLVPLRRYLTPVAASSLLGMLAVTVCGLLVGWIHLAGLQTVRAVDRAHEVAVRLALGAGRLTLLRIELLENGLLSAVSIALAWACVPAGVAFSLRLLPPWIAAGLPIATDWRAFCFLAALTVAGSALLGVASWTVVRDTNLVQALHGRPFGAGRLSRGRFRRSVMTSQIALASAMLYLAALAARSYLTLEGADVGFVRDGLFDIQIPRTAPQRIDALRLEVLRRRLESIPAVVGVSAGSIPDSRYNMTMPVSVGALTTKEDLAGFVRGARVTALPGFFETIGARVVSGSATAPGTGEEGVWLSEQIVRLLSVSGLGPGATVHIGGAPRQVAGIVADIRGAGPEEFPLPYFYVPQLFMGSVSSVLVRMSDPAMMPAVLEVVAEVSGAKSPLVVRSARQLYAEKLALPRARSVMLVLCAFPAVLLGAIGVFRIARETVFGHRREFAVRLALGASPASLRRQLHGHTLGAVAKGLAVGLVLGATVGYGASRWLVGVRSADPASASLTTALLVVAALLATLGPARQMVRVDPSEALRDE